MEILYSGKTRAYLRYRQIPFEEQLSLQTHNRIKAAGGHSCQAGLPESYDFRVDLTLL